MHAASALLPASVLFLAIVGWLIARAWREKGMFERVCATGTTVGSTLPAVTVVVPARNESANIGPCLRSLLAQRYPSGKLRIVAIDDDSQDDTAAIIARLACADARVTFLSAPRLPRGWKGKVHACWYAVEAALAGSPWLCFVDADVRAQPLALASAMQAAQSAGLDLLSLVPRHELGSLAERLVIPCGLYVLGFSQDSARIQSPQSEEVLCTGQFMLVRREAYDRVGGHAMVRGAICEDLELARLFKRNRLKVHLADGSALLTTRMYTGWATLWPGFAKNLVDMLGGASRTVLTAATAVLLSWSAVMLPLMDVVTCRAGEHWACLALPPALLGSAAAFGLHLAGALHFGIPFWYGLTFPLGYTIGAFIAADSIRRRLLHRVEWKGRIYA